MLKIVVSYSWVMYVKCPYLVLQGANHGIIFPPSQCSDWSKQTTKYILVMGHDGFITTIDFNLSTKLYYSWFVFVPRPSFDSELTLQHIYFFLHSFFSWRITFDTLMTYFKLANAAGMLWLSYQVSNPTKRP